MQLSSFLPHSHSNSYWTSSSQLLLRHTPDTGDIDDRTDFAFPLPCHHQTHFSHPPQFPALCNPRHCHPHLHFPDRNHQFKPQFRWFNGRTNKPKTVIVNPAVIVGWRTAKSSPDYVCKCLLRGKDANRLISYIFHFIESTTVFLLAWSICIYDIDILHLWYISSLFVTKIFTTYFMKWIMFVNASWVKRGCFFISCIFNEMDYVVNASCVICKCFLKKRNTLC